MDEPILTARRSGLDTGAAQVGIPVTIVLFLVLAALLAATGAPAWLHAGALLAAAAVVTLVVTVSSRRDTPAIMVYADRITDLRAKPPRVIPFSSVQRWHFHVLTDFGSFMQDRKLRIESPDATITIGRGIKDYAEVQDMVADLLPPEKLDGAPPAQPS
jgi:Na+/melibiose symporter-like transporter